MATIKRKIDAYFFGIESDEQVALSDQAYFYGGLTFMTAVVGFIACYV